MKFLETLRKKIADFEYGYCGRIVSLLISETDEGLDFEIAMTYGLKWLISFRCTNVEKISLNATGWRMWLDEPLISEDSLGRFCFHDELNGSHWTCGEPTMITVSEQSKSQAAISWKSESAGTPSRRQALGIPSQMPD